MPLTRDFKESIMEDLRRDPAYRAAYLGQAIECLHAGEFSLGKVLLRDYVNGTLGFAALSEATSIPAKSLMRMLSQHGNPHADKLFAILSHLQSVERVKVTTAAQPQLRGRRRTAAQSVLARRATAVRTGK